MIADCGDVDGFFVEPADHAVRLGKALRPRYLEVALELSGLAGTFRGSLHCISFRMRHRFR
jgi:hypothetical protein